MTVSIHAASGAADAKSAAGGIGSVVAWALAGAGEQSLVPPSTRTLTRQPRSPSKFRLSEAYENAVHWYSFDPFVYISHQRVAVGAREQGGRRGRDVSIGVSATRRSVSGTLTRSPQAMKEAKLTQRRRAPLGNRRLTR